MAFELSLQIQQDISKAGDMRKGSQGRNSVSTGQHNSTVGSNFHIGCVVEGRRGQADKVGQEEL